MGTVGPLGAFECGSEVGVGGAEPTGAVSCDVECAAEVSLVWTVTGKVSVLDCDGSSCCCE